MYLRGSKFNMTRRRRNSSPLFILTLLIMIAVVVYINLVVVPATPPLFIPTNTPTTSPATFIKNAEDLIAQGKILQGMAAYQEAIKSDPRNSATYITLAQLQVFNGDFQSAIDNAQNAMLINASNSMANAIYGWALGYKGDYLGALGAIKKAIDLDPNNGIAYAYEAEVLTLQYQAGQDILGVIQKATDASREAQRLAPNALETHRARGLVLNITQNYEEAVNEFKAAIAINPNIADLHLSLGTNLKALNQYAQAVEEFNRANALNPADPLPNTYIAGTYLTLGDFPKAIQYAQQAVKVSPLDPYMYGNLAKMFYANHQYRESLDPFRLAIYGGTTTDNVQVKGLPMDNSTVVEYYYLFGLAAARVNACSDALKISQYLQENAADNEIAVYNAKEMVNICQQWITGTSTPTREITPAK